MDVERTEGGASDASLHKRVVDVFDQALAAAPGERRAVVDRLCGDEPAVRDRVHAMLDQDDEGTKAYLLSPMQSVDVERARELAATPAEPQEMPERIGDYRMIRPLGEGGMGAVYLAERERPVPMRVALKVMRLSGDLRRAATRFEQEREVLALMEHVNICRILDGGTTDAGLPFFVMEYVPGARSLTRYAVDEELSIDARLKLFLQVCEAVQHGHDKGILHRDLKPSNVLVGRDGVPRLIDFGIARSLQADAEMATQMTEVGQLMGTLQYMSPEQLETETPELDARSDVYSLGVLLYELLAGGQPYDVKHRSLVDAARIIQEKPPVRPSTQNPALRGDLDTILLKLLEKEPERRYPSAADLAEDVARFRRAEPILARPASLTYQLRLLTRRNRGLAMGLATTAVALVVGIIASTVWAMQAEEQRNVSANMTDFVIAGIVEADPTKTGLPPTIQSLLTNMVEKVDEMRDQPETYARLQASIGRGYAAIGNYSLAEEHLELACGLLEELRGPVDELTLEARVALGGVYLELCRDPDTEDTFNELLPLLREHLPPEHPLTLEAAFSRGVLYYEQSRLTEAERDLEAAVDGWERALGPNAPDTLEAQGVLGLLYMNLDRNEEAGELLHEILEREERILGTVRSDALTNIAFWYLAEEKDDIALGYLERAREYDQLVLGPTHPWTLLGDYHLASFHFNQGDVHLAEELLAESFEIARDTLGWDHPIALSIQEGLAQALYNLGNVELAEEYYEEVIDGRSGYPDRPMPYADVLMRRGANRLTNGDLIGARQDLFESFEIFTARGEDTDAGPGLFLFALAQRFEADGDLDEAARIREILEQ